MNKPIKPTTSPNPTKVARETFRQLATLQIAPTPIAYSKIYSEIAGLPDPMTSVGNTPDITDHPSEKPLLHFAQTLQKSMGELSDFGYQFNRAIKKQDWDEFKKGLESLGTYLIDHPIDAKKVVKTISDDELARKSSGMSLIDEMPKNDPRTEILKDLLYRTLALALTALLKGESSLVSESEALALVVKEAENEIQLKNVGLRLKQLLFQIELKSGDIAEKQELLLRLFGLLLDNVHDLLDHGSWLRGQVEMVQNLIAGPIDHRALQEAARSLKEVIYKQGVLKDGIEESQSSMRKMMASFIERLDSMSMFTGEYQKRFNAYQESIKKSQTTDDLNKVVSALLNDTSSMHQEVEQSRIMLRAAQKEVHEADSRIKELENKLEQLSEMVHEDQLTGSLNRRGMDDVFFREAERADRRGTSICVAMLDLDNFKKLNDTYGHSAGDDALIHLVRIVKNTLRTMDAIARYGGEEFVIIMPETSLDEAELAMTRVQRELTKHFFMVNNEKLFITFSAGVALRAHRESEEAVIKRADKAMYVAKKTGKNRVVKA